MVTGSRRDIVPPDSAIIVPTKPFHEANSRPSGTTPFASVKVVAGRRWVSINEVILDYLMCQPSQTISNFGGYTPDRVTENVKAASFRLNEADLAALRR